jgi:hypothetical protein
MNNQEKYIEDNLKKYIGSEMREKAPEGFTSKVMTRVQMVPVPGKPDRVILNRSLVPYITVAVSLILIFAAFLLQGRGSTYEIPSLLTNLFKPVNLTLPKVDLSTLFRIKFPEFMVYMFLGIFVLLIFDIGLNRLFHKGKS